MPGRLLLRQANSQSQLWRHQPGQHLLRVTDGLPVHNYGGLVRHPDFLPKGVQLQYLAHVCDDSVYWRVLLDESHSGSYQRFICQSPERIFVKANTELRSDRRGRRLRGRPRRHREEDDGRRETDKTRFGKEKKALVGRSSCPRVDEIMRITSHVIISVVYV